MAIVSHNINATTDEHSHVDAKLADLAIGVWQPTHPEIEHLIDHLEKCIHCQIVLGALIVAQVEINASESGSTEVAQIHLSKLAEAIHETFMQIDIEMYIEVTEMQGEDEAHKQFPTLAAHLEGCKTCQSDIEGIRALLHQAVEAGLIEPLPSVRELTTRCLKPR